MNSPTLFIDLNSRPRVPNTFPTIDNPCDYRIAFVGDCPSSDDEKILEPFVGMSGRMLDGTANSVGITRAQCFVGLLTGYRPTNGDITRFEWGGEEIQTGMARLREELAAFRPNIVVLLGQAALHAAKAPNVKPKPSPKGFISPFPIDDWRGTLFLCDDTFSPFFGYKCLATYHPTTIWRIWENLVFFKFDLARARTEGESSELVLPTRTIYANQTTAQLLDRLRAIRSGDLISPDIEGGLERWTLLGIATSPSEAFVIDWNALNPDDRRAVLLETARVMGDPTIGKILQNSLYDNFVLAYGFRILIRGVVDDTMLSGHEIYCELPKSLATQASIWTRQPYYKVSHSAAARKQRQSDPHEWSRYRIYCGLDCCTTYEIALAQRNVLRGDSLRHYRMNMSLLDPIMYMQLKGIRYNSALARDRLAEVEIHKSEFKTRMNSRSAPFNVFGPKDISPKKLAEFLYQHLSLPPQFKKLNGRNTSSYTTDVEALLTLSRKDAHPFVLDCLKYRKLESDAETLSITTDPDGRVRASYSPVGTETGRFNCKGSPTGSGANLTTITKKYRDLYLVDAPDDFAPEGYTMGQFDLSGADGWTVAARCAALGDPTMLEDYRCGIKPAKVIALMYNAGRDAANINNWTREQIIEASAGLNQEGWLYFACKRAQHSTNYLSGPNVGSSQVLKDSYKIDGIPIYIAPSDFKVLQTLYAKGRYQGIGLWHEWAKKELMNKGTLTCASGSTRIFFGRRKSNGVVDHETLRSFVSHEPQHNTTYVTNRAALSLWNDPENRRPNGDLIVQLLHQVHDAIVVQWPTHLQSWAVGKIRTWFSNPIDVGGIQLTIPFEGGYGPSWGECGKEGRVIRF
jgi:uracil-DNA glycosylase family 4